MEADTMSVCVNQSGKNKKKENPLLDLGTHHQI
jgi:hypothetical protein